MHASVEKKVQEDVECVAANYVEDVDVVKRGTELEGTAWLIYRVLAVGVFVSSLILFLIKVWGV